MSYFLHKVLSLAAIPIITTEKSYVLVESKLAGKAKRGSSYQCLEDGFFEGVHLRTFE